MAGMPYESAALWNLHHPIGSPVRVRRVDGHMMEAETGSLAQQWGSFAILSLRGHAGMWTTSVLSVAGTHATVEVNVSLDAGDASS